jgi:DNA mismatch repair protein MutL
VVERPASVVKELCENALDAGATRVDVSIEGGGVAACVVTDDGAGMSEEDLKLSVARHATSKIAALEDLLEIATFGFRGEALPSIASVSRFKIASRPHGADAGVLATTDGSGAPRLEPIGMPAGTRVEVRELFYNVPARRKFLRALATESAHVTEVIDAIALSRPDVTVTLERDGRRVREHLRAASREERVKGTLVGWELARCKSKLGPLEIEAYLSRPEKARMGATGLWVFVNGRPVSDRALARSVAHAYGSVLEPGRYPVGVVYLDLPGSLVDVNVHPQKSEVRFAEPRAVQDAVCSALSSSLGAVFTGQLGLGAPARRHAGPDAGALAGPSPFHEPPAQAAMFSGSGELPAPSAPPVPYPSRGDSPVPLLGTSPEAQVVPPSSRFVAQVRGMYLLCEAEDALIVLDQHAAAERVTFRSAPARVPRARDRRPVAARPRGARRSSIRRGPGGERGRRDRGDGHGPAARRPVTARDRRSPAAPRARRPSRPRHGAPRRARAKRRARLLGRHRLGARDDGLSRLHPGRRARGSRAGEGAARAAEADRVRGALPTRSTHLDAAAVP